MTQPWQLMMSEVAEMTPWSLALPSESTEHL